MSGKLAKPYLRSPTRWYERGPLSLLRHEMDDLFSRFFGEGEEWHFGDRVPTMDVSETEREIEIKVDLPGMKPEEIDIKIAGNTLSIHGEHREKDEEKKENGRTYHRVERRGMFSRTIPLPCPVEEDKIDANYSAGVLSIAVPKSKEARSRRIKVKG